jgi:hypothetical protein
MRSLSDAFEALVARYPDDDETQIFDALYLTASQSLADKTYARALNAASILELQFAKHPDHPGVAHYLIHSYDFPALAQKGLPAALCYADIAPDAYHALHMPSHIFTRVGAWKESIDTNARSIAQAKAENVTSSVLHVWITRCTQSFSWDATQMPVPLLPNHRPSLVRSTPPCMLAPQFRRVTWWSATSGRQRPRCLIQSTASSPIPRR